MAAKIEQNKVVYIVISIISEYMEAMKVFRYVKKMLMLFELFESHPLLDKSLSLGH